MMKDGTQTLRRQSGLKAKQVGDVPLCLRYGTSEQTEMSERADVVDGPPSM